MTDRPHQVRVHLRYVGLPVVGDRLYGGRPLFLSSLKRGYRLKPNQVERPLIDRPALHAAELTLPHPVTNATPHHHRPLAERFERGSEILAPVRPRRPVVARRSTPGKTLVGT